MKRLVLMLVVCVGLLLASSAASASSGMGDTDIRSDSCILDITVAADSDKCYYTVIDGFSVRLYSYDCFSGESSELPLFGIDTAVYPQEEKTADTDETVRDSEMKKTVAEIVDAAMTIIYRNEGSYGSVNKNDNGAVSIGKVQWHATRALNLLKTIVNADRSQALSILGDSLYNEIISSTDWESRTLDSAEASAVSALLVTDEGKAAQDALAAVDITAYVKHAVNLGMESATAMVYFADLENQWGYGGAEKQAKIAMQTAGSYAAVTLDILHSTCLAYTSNYHTRRNSVYNYCLSLGWDKEPQIESFDVDRNSCYAYETLHFSLSADDADSVTLIVCRDDASAEQVYSATQSYTEKLEWTPAEGGSFSVFCRCSNDFGYRDSIEITVKVIGVYQLSFDAQGGSCDCTGLSFSTGDKLRGLPAPQRDYYVFGGWYSKPLGQGTLFEDGDRFTFSEDVTFYAYWLVDENACIGIDSGAVKADAVTYRLCGNATVPKTCYAMAAFYNGLCMVGCSMRQVDLTDGCLTAESSCSQGWDRCRIFLLDEQKLALCSYHEISR